MKPYVTIGIDPSLTNTGLVVVDCAGDLVTSQSLKSKKSGDRPLDEIRRLKDLVERIYSTALASLEHGPCLAVGLEGMAFMAKNTRSIVQLSSLNFMLRKKFMLDWKKDTYIVSPTSLKKFVSGKGNCPKDQMFLETYKRWGVEFPDNDQCDAYGLARIALAMTEGDKRAYTKPQQEVIKLLSKQYGRD